MAPILIDGRDILKLGLVSVLVTILVFVAGFFIGHQRAATFYQAGSEIKSLSLPEQTAAMENIADLQIPSKIEAGENIDVDQPETVAQLDPLSKDSISQSVAPSPENKKVPVIQKAKQDKNNSATKKTPTELRNSQTVNNKKNNSRTNKNNSSVLSAFTSHVASEIKYSIQVGMYGRLVNAENMVNTLHGQQYDAYVTDYTNRKNEIRYNVRIGYFVDKKSAIATLNKFKAGQKGDGYLVKFSADNIVNLAGAADVKQTVDAPVHDNDAGKELTPAKLPVDIVEDKISQVNVLSNTFITAN